MDWVSLADVQAYPFILFCRSNVVGDRKQETINPAIFMRLGNKTTLLRKQEELLNKAVIVKIASCVGGVSKSNFFFYFFFLFLFLVCANLIIIFKLLVTKDFAG